MYDVIPSILYFTFRADFLSLSKIKKIRAMKNIFISIISVLMLAFSSSVFAEEELKVNVNQHAYFPGGQTALATWLSENLKYPQECIDKKVEGEVIVSFIVERDGSITGIHMEQSVDPKLDAEAKRVVGVMPNWVAAEMNGVKTRSRLMLPIRFTLPQTK